MTEQSIDALGRILRGYLRWAPDLCHQAALSRSWSHLAPGQPFQRRLAELEGKRIAVEITDTGNRWSFRVDPPRLTPLGVEAAWDVRVRGDTEGLLRLALGVEDADTLFFNRRLSLEGDTATGVYLKNFLDALEFDWEAHREALQASVPRPLRGPLQGLWQRLDPPARAIEARHWLLRYWLGEGKDADPLSDFPAQGATASGRAER
jgi:predicted lipid carrier protein YhbT